jgi:hypothetical protein
MLIAADDLKMMLQVSSIKIGSGFLNGSRWSFDSSVELLGVECRMIVSEAERCKCPRCWTYAAEAEVELCERCSTVLLQEGTIENLTSI